MNFILNPCVNCQSHDIEIKPVGYENFGECQDCLAEGPKRLTPELAAQAWNEVNPVRGES